LNLPSQLPYILELCRGMSASWRFHYQSHCSALKCVFWLLDCCKMWAGIR
jgi:hypothetical protein